MRKKIGKQVLPASMSIDRVTNIITDAITGSSSMTRLKNVVKAPRIFMPQRRAGVTQTCKSSGMDNDETAT
eukprot:873067-Amphidinium_carterae.1